MTDYSRLHRPDLAPNIKQAGISTKPTESIASCLFPSAYDGPGTPPHLKKYRKSH